MSQYARFFIFTGLMIVLILFVALALSGALYFWNPAYVVKSVEIR